MLGTAAGVGVSEVVAASDDVGAGRAVVVRREGLVNEGGAFGRLYTYVLVCACRVRGWKDGETDLDHDEPRAIGVGPRKVDIGLVVRDIEALHASVGHAGAGQEGEKSRGLHGV